MTTSESALPRWQRRLAGLLPLDVVTAWAVAAAALAGARYLDPGATRFVLAAPLLFFVPGYVLVAALFPHRERATGTPSLFGASDRVTLRERLALSFGLSVAVLPILGVLVAVSPWGLDGRPIAATVVGFVFVVGVAASVRRRRLPRDARFILPVADWVAEARRAVGHGEPVDRALNVALLGSLLLLLLTGGYVLAVPQDGEQFTDVAVLTEDGGELVAGDYAEELEAGESTELVAAVENHEADAQEYTVVVTAERPADSERGAAEEELDRFRGSVAVGERWTHEHEVAPTLVGERVRLNYYVYRGGAPEDVGPASAYRHLYLWVTVTEG